MVWIRYVLIILVVILMPSVGFGKDKQDGLAPFPQLLSWMTGEFSSAEQAKADTNFRDIRLHMVQIWKERSDCYWLYVEQATAEALDKPYRQRVYRLTQLNDYTFKSAVYTMEEPLRFAGEWQKPQPLATLTPDSLTERTGCAIMLIYEDDSIYVGSTRAKGCESILRGAKYATSEVTITASRLVSWDRGYDADDKQVWGATTGGYIFKKL